MNVAVKVTVLSVWLGREGFAGRDDANNVQRFVQPEHRAAAITCVGLAPAHVAVCEHDDGRTLRHLERLPAYAPEVNPAEGVWHYLKHVELKNVVCRSLIEVRQYLGRAVARVRQKAKAIRGFLRLPGYL